MGKLLPTDKRYKMLLKIPKVRDGRVVFRKKPGKAKYVIAVIETDDEVHLVLYRFLNIVDEGHPITMMTFRDFAR